jgi:nuclear pore complex protein Nup210
MHLNTMINTMKFYEWRLRVNDLIPRALKRYLNSLIILAAWSMWKHQNNVVFNGANTSIQLVLRQIAREVHLWCLDGARGFIHLEVLTHR